MRNVDLQSLSIIGTAIEKQSSSKSFLLMRMSTTGPFTSTPFSPVSLAFPSFFPFANPK